MLADVMARWYRQQLRLMSARPSVLPRQAWQEHSPATPTNEIEARITAAMEDLRDLHEAGEIDCASLSPQAAYEFVFLGGTP